MPGLRDGRTRPSTLTIVMFPLDLLGLTFFLPLKVEAKSFQNRLKQLNPNSTAY